MSNTRQTRSGLLRLSLLSLAISAGHAHAQDSGLGVDLQFGNALNPAGKLDHGCDPASYTWLAGEPKRTPTGFLYACVPATPDYAEDGEWLTRATFQLGHLSVTGDENAMQWRRFSNWDDGMTLGADLRFEHPSDGRYFEFHGSLLNEYSQYFRALLGKAGKYRIQAFVRTQPNVTSGNARSIWNGVGSRHLTLKEPLAPSASTVAQVAAVSAAQPESILKVVRDKQGLGITYAFDKRWTGYFNGSHESRKGARQFGGPFFFNFAFANNGGAYEIPRPIDDSTINLNGGLRFVGNLWRMEFGYSGSYFRNAYNSFDYEVPLGTYSVVPVPTPQLGLGEFSYEPDNDYHQLRASFSRKIAWNGDFSLTTSLSRSSQNDDLVAPINCQGQFGIPLPGFLYDCADWNTTAALSRTKADLAIDSQLLDARVVLQPTDDITWRASVRFQRDDYDGTYWAYNPLTGQYGYISENGVQGSVVPGEMGVWDPGDRASVLTRVRNLPLDKEIREASTGADWRLGAGNTIGATYTFTRTNRTHREVEATDDNSLKLNWTNRALDWLTLRVNYTYLKRSGSDYEYDPYEFTFSSDLPGYVAPAAGTMAHTVEELRKYDVSSRDQNKLDVMATFILPREMTIYASLRGDWNDYDAVLGRQKYDTLGASLQWEWQPNPGTVAGAWYGHDRSKLAFANVNDSGALTDNPSLGGENYPDSHRWWVDDKQRNHYAGASWSQRLGRATLDGSWNWTYSRGTTGYRLASPAALTDPALAPLLTGEYPPMVYRSNSYTLSLSFPLAPRVGMRLFDTYEKAVLSDWHYLGFGNGQVIDHRVYTDGGPESYSVNLLGVLLEIQL